jgi:hypothetical protein
MADSDSFFDDDDLIDDSFAGAPSEELLRESEGSFENLDDVGLDSDTPDAAIPQEELIAKAQEEASIEEDTEQPAEASETAEAAVATKPAKKKSRFNFGAIDTSEITIFDAALLISLIFISLATLMMFFELRQFGNFPFDGFPWRTDKF